MSQVAADLRAAAEVLRRDGWRRGSLHTGPNCEGPHCARGAIHVAVGVCATYSSLDPGLVATAEMRANAAESAMEAVLGGREPVWFNDAPGRTADEVIAALLAAADAAEVDQ